MRPFEVEPDYLIDRLEEMVDVTFSDLESQFIVLPRGNGFIEYGDFQTAYEVLKRHTSAFSIFTENTVWAALCEDALSLVVLRTILGMSPPEWAELARLELNVVVTSGYTRRLDTDSRTKRNLFSRLTPQRNAIALARAKALVSVAVEHITKGPAAAEADEIHRLDKVDTAHGIESLKYVASQHVPYAVLLYERYLGRPFASHRDAVSGIVGDMMENAIEERLRSCKITYRKTGRAERVPGYKQAPDFFVPDEFNPAVIIEAKVAGDDGTVRDKVARILRLAGMRDERVRQGQPGFQVVACIEGRGFGVRREDMRNMLRDLQGKVFTFKTLDNLIQWTRLREFVPEGLTKD